MKFASGLGRPLLALALASGFGCSHRGAPLVRSQPASPTGSTRRPSPRKLVQLAAHARSRFKLFVPARLLAPTGGKRAKTEPKLTKAEALDQARLRASVDDLAAYVQRMSGASLEVVAGEPPANEPTSSAILVGELARARFGDLTTHVIGKQAFRVVVNDTTLGLYGESDLATSYAIYEILDRLGCRWFMPGALGEEIPRRDELSLEAGDDELAPSTLYRNLWFGDEAYKRRNRLGGAVVAAGHHLERWISAQQRDEHPEWRAVVGGVPHATRLRWSNPEVASAIVASIEASLEKRPADSVSLSPADGLGFDDTVDRSLDAGDWDPTMNTVSLTDRLLVLANRVAGELTPKHPDLTLGLLAYVSYTRPPLREHVHPNVVPVIAPITYCRAQPLSDDRCPGATDLKKTVEGWAERSTRLALRSYAYNLAEPSAPYPMLRKWSFDLPFMFAHKVQFFQPETLPNFETTLPALYLGVRLAWDTRRSPASILDELFSSFYGHAAREVRAYTELVDAAWVDVPEYAGNDLSYGKRFTPATLARARKAMDAAKAACKTETEIERVAMLDASLGQFELYMKLRSDLASGRTASLAADAQHWLDTAQALAERYADNSAFGKARWAGQGGVYGNYFTRFHQAVYQEATRIHEQERPLTEKPLCSFRLEFAPQLKLPTSESPHPLGSDAKVSDVCNDTWSSLGRHDYFGAAWYETDVPPSTVGAQPAFLWMTRVDGMAQVWVNGAPVALAAAGTDPPGTLPAEAHGKPLTWDISGRLRADGPNRIAIAVLRTKLAELGAGGVLGPVYLYAHR